MNIPASMVKDLREESGAGIMDCKEALKEANSDYEKAKDILRKKGLSKALKKKGRDTSQGVIASYIHPGGKIGVLVELNCETDFVAMTDEFQSLLKDIAMQIAASNPSYLKSEDIPVEVIAKEREIFTYQAKESGKPDNVIKLIVDGKMERYFAEVCLVEQPFIKDSNITINELISQRIAKLGENISIGRFVRYEVGKE
ncbi:MAG: translation elongation factor Ts [Nitrospinae bacterium]|nr:translation elongation factor Ts [Nitrospinota bacterium]